MKARKWPLNNELSSSLAWLQTLWFPPDTLLGKRRPGKGQDGSPPAQAAGWGYLHSSPRAGRAHSPQAGAGPASISHPEAASDGLHLSKQLTAPPVKPTPFSPSCLHPFSAAPAEPPAPCAVRCCLRPPGQGYLHIRLAPNSKDSFSIKSQDGERL